MCMWSFVALNLVQLIGWRQVSRKLLLFITDAGFHFAGDGKVGGIRASDTAVHIVYILNHKAAASPHYTYVATRAASLCISDLQTAKKEMI